MRIYREKLKNKSNTVITVAALMFAILLIIYSDEAKTAAADAVNSCLTTVIPCIFPFLTVSLFILEAGFPVKFRYFTDNFLKKAFGLSGNCTEAVILGLTGGYNTAVKSAVKLREINAVSAEQAKRIVLFFTNAGVSFTVLLTGTAVTGSFVFGIRLYIVSISTNIILAYIYNIFKRNTEDSTIHIQKQNPSDAFVKAISASSSSIISISFSIILFSCVTCILRNIMPFGILNSLTVLLSEVTSAVFFSAKQYPLYILAGILSFGGFCIFIQILPELTKLKIKPSNYIFVRFIHGIICMAAEYIISIFFPITEYTSAYYNTVKLNSGNTAGSVALIFLCAVYLVSVKNIKIKGVYDK